MIRLWEDDRIWVGSSDDEARTNLGDAGIGAILNVAQDLTPTRGWAGPPPEGGVEYMHVGLIDGPGNPVSAYCAAVLALKVLAGRAKVLVCCHTGARSMVVAMAYMSALVWRRPTFAECAAIMWERGLCVDSWIHTAHQEAFNRINWRALTRLLEV